MSKQPWSASCGDSKGFEHRATSSGRFPVRIHSAAHFSVIPPLLLTGVGQANGLNKRQGPLMQEAEGKPGRGPESKRFQTCMMLRL